MRKKAERVARPAKVEKSDRWTVRGVPAKLQKAAGDAARARGMTLGQWLSGVLATALPQRPASIQIEAAERWEEAIERRVARLEAMVRDGDVKRPDATAAAARPS